MKMLINKVMCTQKYDLVAIYNFSQNFLQQDMTRRMGEGIMAEKKEKSEEIIKTGDE